MKYLQISTANVQDKLYQQSGIIFLMLVNED